MTTLRSRIRVRRQTGGDRTVSVQYVTSTVGRLLVAEVRPTAFGFPIPLLLTATWGYLWGASSSAPQLLKRVRVMAVGGSQTVRLGLMTTPAGTPTVANAFLLYDATIATSTPYEWTGSVVLSDRYLYGYSTGAATACVCYLDYELVTP